LTRKEFQDHFEKIFFSEDTKRMDYQLVSATQKEQQEEYREKNKEHKIFKDALKRVEVKDTIVEFKKQSGLHPDVYKANFVTNDLLIKNGVDPCEPEEFESVA
jgi:hypothetical protein